MSNQNQAPAPQEMNEIELQNTTEFLPIEEHQKIATNVLLSNLDKKISFFIEIHELNELISFARSKRKVFWLKYGSSARKTDKDIKKRIQEWEARIQTLKRYGILFNTM
jgi:hypothetical protein